MPQSISTEMRLFILTCDIFGTGQTNILALRYLFEKTYKPAHSSAPQVTEINKLDQITEKWLLTWAHTFHWRLWWFTWNVWNWEVYLSEPVFKHTHLIVRATFNTKKCGLGFLISARYQLFAFNNSWAGLLKAGLRNPRLSAKFELRCESSDQKWKF